MATIDCFSQNIFFCIQHTRETYIGLEQVEDEEMMTVLILGENIFKSFKTEQIQSLINTATFLEKPSIPPNITILNLKNKNMHLFLKVKKKRLVSLRLVKTILFSLSLSSSPVHFYKVSHYHKD